MPRAKISTERRSNPRFSIKVPVKYRLAGHGEMLSVDEWRKSEKNAVTLDLSLGGMQIVVEESLKMGSLLKFNIYLLDKKNVIEVYAKVAWANQTGTGLKFLMIKSEDAEHLKSFLNKTFSR